MKLKLYNGILVFQHINILKAMDLVQGHCAVLQVYAFTGLQSEEIIGWGIANSD